MKISRFVTTIATAALVCVSSAGIAGASPVEAGVSSQHVVLTYDEDGNPTSGYVEFDTNDQPGIAPLATVNVGGGTWTYGSTYTSDGSKICYSRYIHNTKTHKATATMNGTTRTSTAGPGRWANAEVVGGVLSGWCNTYWSTQ